MVEARTDGFAADGDAGGVDEFAGFATCGGGAGFEGSFEGGFRPIGELGVGFAEGEKVVGGTGFF